MIELVSAKETLDFLAKSAPRPWVKQMILWMIFDGELTACFRKGRSVAQTRAFAIVMDAIEGADRPDQWVAMKRQHFQPEMADRLVAAGEMGEIEDLVCEWPERDEPRVVSHGHTQFPIQRVSS